jgi:hypothetical protein
MRIVEILSKSLTEAISVAKYEDNIIQAIKEAIYDSFGDLLKLKGQYPDEEREFDDEDGNHKSFISLMKNKFRSSLKWRIADKIHKTLNRELGSPVVTYVSVIALPESVGGQADGRAIELNSVFTDHLTKNIMDKAFDSTYSSYGPGEYVSGFYFLCKMVSSEDRHLAGIILDDKKIIKKISSIVIHELVHVLQHAAQYDRGREETEYRSYLDKRKGEFVDLHHKKYAQEKNSDEEDTDLQDKYNRYYRASPQEIAAFAHQAALQVIDDYGFSDVTNPDELTLSDDSIIYSVDWITGRVFSKPKTPKEAMVRKRYMKLVYLEVKRYIEHRKQVLAGKA